MIPSAQELAEQVRCGGRTAVDVLDEAVARIERLEPRVNAFQHLTLERARREAEAIDARADRSTLPLAGVPVVVKDDVAVQGVAVRKGSMATDAVPRDVDDLMVTRLGEAGAVLLGTTRVPEFYVSGLTETPAFGTTTNPWDLRRTSGGSSGGTGAALAAGYAPIGIGSDGLGSIRIPAACCGLFGIKPGPGVVPHAHGAATWFDMSEHGPLATTVSDAALLLDVLDGTSRHRDPAPPEGPLRIALSFAVPVRPARLAASVTTALRDAAAALRSARHAVVEFDPPYPARLGIETARRYFTAFLDDAEGLDPRLFERRTRHQAEIGRLLRRVAPSRASSTDALRERMDAWFEEQRIDVCLMPTLLRSPLPVGSVLGRGWLSAALIQTRFIQHTYLANLVRYPAASVPMGVDPDGLPRAVQLVAPRDREETILSVARELELRRPWPRTAPLALAE